MEIIQMLELLMLQEVAKHEETVLHIEKVFYHSQHHHLLLFYR